MGETEYTEKIMRVLEIYDELKNGKLINKEKMADRYQVSPRTIQRDIEDLRNYFSNIRARNGEDREVLYDHTRHGFRLVQYIPDEDETVSTK